MSLSKVESALITQIEATISSWQIAYENANGGFTKPAPTGSNKWAAVTFLPSVPGIDSGNELGSSGRDWTTGLIQIDLNYAPDTGTLAPKADFETIRAAFAKGSSLTYSSQVVTIRATGRNQGRIVDGWFRISVSIYWHALIPR